VYRRRFDGTDHGYQYCGRRAQFGHHRENLATAVFVGDEAVPFLLSNTVDDDNCGTRADYTDVKHSEVIIAPFVSDVPLNNV
jgi:hypothetical protein